MNPAFKTPRSGVSFTKDPVGDWQSWDCESGLLGLRAQDYFLPDMPLSAQAMWFPNDSLKDARVMSKNGLTITCCHYDKNNPKYIC